VVYKERGSNSNMLEVEKVSFYNLILESQSNLLEVEKFSFFKSNFLYLNICPNNWATYREKTGRRMEFTDGELILVMDSDSGNMYSSHVQR
jgi:hypothetical protein